MKIPVDRCLITHLEDESRVWRYLRWLAWGDPPSIKVKRSGEWYKVVDGNHRTLAAKLAGVQSIEVEIVE